MNHVQSQEEIEFLRNLELRRGSPIGYRTYSTFYADTDGTIRDYGVMLYESGGRFWLQDFEREPTFLGFKIRRRDDEQYEMFETSFSPLDVVSLRKVNKSTVRSRVFNGKSPTDIPTANPVLSFFRETVTEFLFSDGSAMYFQLIDRTVPDMIEKTKNDKGI